MSLALASCSEKKTENCSFGITFIRLPAFLLKSYCQEQWKQCELLVSLVILALH